MEEDDAVVVKIETRKLFVRFLLDAALNIGDVYWFTVRGNNELALSTLTMVPEEHYAALLLAAELVTLNRVSGGGYMIKSTKEGHWDPLIDEGGLSNKNKVSQGYSEITKSTVYLDCFKRRKKNSPIDKEGKGKRKPMVQIRIGQYEEEGETIKASLQLKDGVEPPSLRNLREIQTQFFIDIKPLLKATRIEQRDRVKAVMKWVDMMELREEFAAYSPDNKIDDELTPEKPSIPDKPVPASESEPASKPSSMTADNTTPPSQKNGPMISGATNTVDASLLLKAISTATTHVPPAANLGDVSSSFKAVPNTTMMAQANNNPIVMAAVAAANTANTTIASKDADTTIAYKTSEISTATEMGTEVEYSFTVTSKLYPDGHPNAEYKLLNSLNIDVMNRSKGIKGEACQYNREGMLRELVRYSEDNDVELGYNTLSGGYRYKLVKVPANQTKDGYYKTAKRQQWIESMLESSLANGDLGEALSCMIEYLIARHGQVAKEKLTELGVIPKMIDEYGIAATMNQANIGVGQWREIVKCFKAFQEVDKVCVSEDAWRRLGEDHGAIETGTYDWYKNGQGKRPEKVNWWTMDPADELCRRLADFANSTINFDPDCIEAIFSAYCGDHATKNNIGKFRFGTKTVMRLRDKDNKPMKHTAVYPLADVKCTGDKAIVFKNTVRDNLVKGINKLCAGKVKFDKNEETGTWTATIIDKDHPNFNDGSKNVKDVVIFMVGDLKYYYQMLGKEGMTRHWCYLCKLRYEEWQEAVHALGEEWDLQKLLEWAAASAGLSGTDRMGSKESPYFDIEVWNYIWPLLHWLIGIGNAVLKLVVNFADTEVQHKPARQIRLQEDVKELDNLIAEQQGAMELFDGDGPNSGKEEIKRLKLLRRDAVDSLEELNEVAEDEEYETDDQLEEDRVELNNRVKDLGRQIVDLEDERREIQGMINEWKEDREKKIEQIAALTRARKTDEDSVYSGIDRILQTYDIIRAAYHGGDLNGVDIRTLMDNATEIMEKIAEYLISSKSVQCTKTPAEIRKVCKDAGKLLEQWDAVLTLAHEEFPTDADFEFIEQYVKNAMKSSREMGLTTPLKNHGGEDHLVKQMKRVKSLVGCGLKDFDESWWEQYHQTGSNFDMKHRNMGSTEKRAKCMVSNDRRANKPKTIALIAKVKKKFTRGQRKSTKAKKEQKAKLKKEKRQKAHTLF